MHKYLRAIGFSKYRTYKEMEELIKQVINDADGKNYISTDDKSMLGEFCKDFAENIGICVRGEFEEFEDLENSGTRYYFPYLRSNVISSVEEVSIERHAEKESYAGVCDDVKVGVILIFYLQNMISSLKLKNSGRFYETPNTLSLSALSCQGRIMMPIEKQQEEEARVRKVITKRNTLLTKARQGDEEAIETLTLEDMDMYSNISKRIYTEDIYSLVDTFFMPYGVESDHYSVLGEIKDCKKVINSFTQEECYIMTLSANDLIFDVCINEKDLYGEPAAGRRFKGIIWLQGYVNYPDV